MSARARGSRLLPAVLAGACLAACRVGPNYHAPALPPKAEAPLVSLNAAAETTATPPDAWWRLYDDPRLDQLVQEALKANFDLAAADANFAAARAALSAVHANRYPSTGIVAGGVYGRDPVTEEILELQGQRPQKLWLFEDAFQVAYEVDLFGRVHRAIEAANANADAVAAARDDVRVVVAAETARAYAALCALGEEIDVAHRSLDVVSHQADITTHQYEAGGNSQFDVKRAEALVAQVESSIPTLEGQRRAALFELTAVLGRTPAEAPQDVEACRRPPQLTALLPIGDGAALIRRRPDVRQAERRLAAATAQIGVATADLYPTDSPGGLLWRSGGPGLPTRHQHRRDVGHRSLDQLDFPEPGRAARPHSAGESLPGSRTGHLRLRGAHRARGNRAGVGLVRSGARSSAIARAGAG